MRRRFWSVAVALVACACVTMTLVACGAKVPGAASSAEESPAAGTEVRVAVLDAPGSYGLMPLVKRSRAGETALAYSFALASDYTIAMDALEQGTVDLAVVHPAGAVRSYYHTEGGVVVIDVASYLDWYVMSTNKTIKGLEGLAGHTLYMGSGETASYAAAMRHVLQLAGLTGQVTLEYGDDPVRAVASITADASQVGCIGEPQATKAQLGNGKIQRLASVSDEWKRLQNDGSCCVGYVVAARREFVEEHPDAVAEFLADHEDSVAAFLKDPRDYAADAVDFGLAPDEETCTAIAPNAQLTFVSGEEMRQTLAGFLEVLSVEAPTTLENGVPADDFYYLGTAQAADEGAQ